MSSRVALAHWLRPEVAAAMALAADLSVRVAADQNVPAPLRDLALAVQTKFAALQLDAEDRAARHDTIVHTMHTPEALREPHP